jgi:hypothetical protein
MNELSKGCKVKCVDATLLPINVPGAVQTEFEFPMGMLKEGCVYLVERCVIDSRGNPVLWIAGSPVLYRGSEIPWNGLRFRRLPETTRLSRNCSVRISSELLTAAPL